MADNTEVTLVEKEESINEEEVNEPKEPVEQKKLTVVEKLASHNFVNVDVLFVQACMTDDLDMVNLMLSIGVIDMKIGWLTARHNKSKNVMVWLKTTIDQCCDNDNTFNSYRQCSIVNGKIMAILIPIINKANIPNGFYKFINYDDNGNVLTEDFVFEEEIWPDKSDIIYTRQTATSQMDNGYCYTSRGIETPTGVIPYYGIKNVCC